MQHKWTRLPQGFKNTPTIFGEAFALELQQFLTKDIGCVLLHYIDDLWLGHETLQGCAAGTDKLLCHLGEMDRYEVSEKKAQTCQRQGKYLGFILQQGERRLGVEWKQVI